MPRTRKPNVVDYSCWPCKYYCFSSRCCDYYLITKQHRNCTAGEGCDKFSQRTAADRKKFGSHLWFEPAESLKIRACYEEGLNDAEIGHRLGIPPYRISNWRHAYNLPSVAEQRKEAGSDWI